MTNSSVPVTDWMILGKGGRPNWENDSCSDPGDGN